VVISGHHPARDVITQEIIGPAQPGTTLETWNIFSSKIATTLCGLSGLVLS